MKQEKEVGKKLGLLTDVFLSASSPWERCFNLLSKPSMIECLNQEREKKGWEKLTSAEEDYIESVIKLKNLANQEKLSEYEKATALAELEGLFTNTFKIIETDPNKIVKPARIQESEFADYKQKFLSDERKYYMEKLQDYKDVLLEYISGTKRFVNQGAKFTLIKFYVPFLLRNKFFERDESVKLSLVAGLNSEIKNCLPGVIGRISMYGNEHTLTSEVENHFRNKILQQSNKRFSENHEAHFIGIPESYLGKVPKDMYWYLAHEEVSVRSRLLGISKFSQDFVNEIFQDATINMLENMLYSESPEIIVTKHERIDAMLRKFVETADAHYRSSAYYQAHPIDPISHDYYERLHNISEDVISILFDDDLKPRPVSDRINIVESKYGSVINFLSQESKKFTDSLEKKAIEMPIFKEFVLTENQIKFLHNLAELEFIMFEKAGMGSVYSSYMTPLTNKQFLEKYGLLFENTPEDAFGFSDLVAKDDVTIDGKIFRLSILKPNFEQFTKYKLFNKEMIVEKSFLDEHFDRTNIVAPDSKGSLLQTNKKILDLYKRERYGFSNRVDTLASRLYSNELVLGYYNDFSRQSKSAKLSMGYSLERTIWPDGNLHARPFGDVDITGYGFYPSIGLKNKDPKVIKLPEAIFLNVIINNPDSVFNTDPASAAPFFNPVALEQLTTAPLRDINLVGSVADRMLERQMQGLDLALCADDINKIYSKIFNPSFLLSYLNRYSNIIAKNNPQKLLNDLSLAINSIFIAKGGDAELLDSVINGDAGYIIMKYWPHDFSKFVQDNAKNFQSYFFDVIKKSKLQKLKMNNMMRACFNEFPDLFLNHINTHYGTEGVVKVLSQFDFSSERVLSPEMKFFREVGLGGIENLKTVLHSDVAVELARNNLDLYIDFLDMDKEDIYSTKFLLENPKVVNAIIDSSPREFMNIISAKGNIVEKWKVMMLEEKRTRLDTLLSRHDAELKVAFKKHYNVNVEFAKGKGLLSRYTVNIRNVDSNDSKFYYFKDFIDKIESSCQKGKVKRDLGRVCFDDRTTTKEEEIGGVERYLELAYKDDKPPIDNPYYFLDKGEKRVEIPTQVIEHIPPVAKPGERFLTEDKFTVEKPSEYKTKFSKGAGYANAIYAMKNLVGCVLNKDPKCVAENAAGVAVSVLAPMGVEKAFRVALKSAKEASITGRVLRVMGPIAGRFAGNVFLPVKIYGDVQKGDPVVIGIDGAIVGAEVLFATIEMLGVATGPIGTIVSLTLFVAGDIYEATVETNELSNEINLTGFAKVKEGVRHFFNMGNSKQDAKFLEIETAVKQYANDILENIASNKAIYESAEYVAFPDCDIVFKDGAVVGQSTKGETVIDFTKTPRPDRGDGPSTLSSAFTGFEPSCFPVETAFGVEGVEVTNSIKKDEDGGVYHQHNNPDPENPNLCQNAYMVKRQDAPSTSKDKLFYNIGTANLGTANPATNSSNIFYNDEKSNKINFDASQAYSSSAIIVDAESVNLKGSRTENQDSLMFEKAANASALIIKVSEGEFYKGGQGATMTNLNESDINDDKKIGTFENFESLNLLPTHVKRIVYVDNTKQNPKNNLTFCSVQKFDEINIIGKSPTQQVFDAGGSSTIATSNPNSFIKINKDGSAVKILYQAKMKDAKALPIVLDDFFKVSDVASIQYTGKAENGEYGYKIRLRYFKSENGEMTNYDKTLEEKGAVVWYQNIEIKTTESFALQIEEASIIPILSKDKKKAHKVEHFEIHLPPQEGESLADYKGRFEKINNPLFSINKKGFIQDGEGAQRLFFKSGDANSIFDVGVLPKNVKSITFVADSRANNTFFIPYGKDVITVIRSNDIEENKPDIVRLLSFENFPKSEGPYTLAERVLVGVEAKDAGLLSADIEKKTVPHKSILPIRLEVYNKNKEKVAHVILPDAVVLRRSSVAPFVHVEPINGYKVSLPGRQQWNLSCYIKPKPSSSEVSFYCIRSIDYRSAVLHVENDNPNLLPNIRIQDLVDHKYTKLVFDKILSKFYFFTEGNNLIISGYDANKNILSYRMLDIFDPEGILKTRPEFGLILENNQGLTTSEGKQLFGIRQIYAMRNELKSFESYLKLALTSHVNHQIKFFKIGEELLKLPEDGFCEFEHNYYISKKRFVIDTGAFKLKSAKFQESNKADNVQDLALTLEDANKNERKIWLRGIIAKNPNKRGYDIQIMHNGGKGILNFADMADMFYSDKSVNDIEKYITDKIDAKNLILTASKGNIPNTTPTDAESVAYELEPTDTTLSATEVLENFMEASSPLAVLTEEEAEHEEFPSEVKIGETSFEVKQDSLGVLGNVVAGIAGAGTSLAGVSAYNLGSGYCKGYSPLGDERRWLKLFGVGGVGAGVTVLGLNALYNFLDWSGFSVLPSENSDKPENTEFQTSGVQSRHRGFLNSLFTLPHVVYRGFFNDNKITVNTEESNMDSELPLQEKLPEVSSVTNDVLNALPNYNRKNLKGVAQIDPLINLIVKDEKNWIQVDTETSYYPLSDNEKIVITKQDSINTEGIEVKNLTYKFPNGLTYKEEALPLGENMLLRREVHFPKLTAEEKKSYRVFAKSAHPDKGGSSDKFIEAVNSFGEEKIDEEIVFGNEGFETIGGLKVEPDRAKLLLSFTEEQIDGIASSFKSSFMASLPAIFIDNEYLRIAVRVAIKAVEEIYNGTLSLHKYAGDLNQCISAQIKDQLLKHYMKKLKAPEVNKCSTRMVEDLSSCHEMNQKIEYLSKAVSYSVCYGASVVEAGVRLISWDVMPTVKLLSNLATTEIGSRLGQKLVSSYIESLSKEERKGIEKFKSNVIEVGGRISDIFSQFTDSYGGFDSESEGEYIVQQKSKIKQDLKAPASPSI